MNAVAVRQNLKGSAEFLLGEKYSNQLLSAWRKANQNKYALRCRIHLLRKLFPPDPSARCLNIGGGDWYYSRWENVDFYADDIFIDYKVDFGLKQRISIADGEAAAIFCSHVLEHLSNETCMHILRECHRLLKPGGVLRIAVPDMERAIQAYTSEDEDFFDHGGVYCTGDSLEAKFVNFFASYFRSGPKVAVETVREKFKTLDRYEFVDWCVSLIDRETAGHVNGYDFDKLRRLLAAVGFERIEKSSYRASSFPVMRESDFDNRPTVSLFVEATR